MIFHGQFGSAGADIARAVAVDAAGHMAIAGGVGGEHNDAGNILNTNHFARLVGPDARQLREDVVASTGSDIVEALAIDAAGRLVLVGTVWGDVFGTRAGSFDAFVRVLDAPGGVRLQAPR